MEEAVTGYDIESIRNIAKGAKKGGRMVVIHPDEVEWLCAAAKLLEDITMEQGNKRDVLTALNAPWVPVFNRDMYWPLGKEDRLFWRNRENQNLVAVKYLNPRSAKRPFVAIFRQVETGLSEEDSIDASYLPIHPEEEPQ